MNLPYAIRDALTNHPIRAADDDELWAALETLKQSLADIRAEQERRRLGRAGPHS